MHDTAFCQFLIFWFILISIKISLNLKIKPIVDIECFKNALERQMIIVAKKKILY